MEALPEEAAALASYLTHKGVPFMDTLAAGMGVSKLVTSVRMWANQLAVPASLYVRNTERLLQVVAEKAPAMFGERFIAKDIVGAKGKHNYLIAFDELQQTIENNPDIQFICQRFIPNDGDYRVGVYVSKARFIICRRGSGESHLNNTSTGGKAEYIPSGEFPEDLKQLAIDAADAAGLQVSGVDIIVDKTTQRPYILEVNQGSQIVTGAFTHENIASFSDALQEAVSRRYNRAHTKPLPLIGRRSTPALPELGIVKVAAKVDSGAYLTTLHAENIHTESRDGSEVLVFELVANSRLQLAEGTRKTVTVPVFTQELVRSSNGQAELRFSFKTSIVVQGKTLPVKLTLSDRSQLGWPMLLGRGVLRSHFLINVELTQDNSD